MNNIESLFPAINHLPEKYIDVIKAHTELKLQKGDCNFKIKILTNITINNIKEILELCLWNNNISAKIEIGEYDNIIQESLSDEDFDCVIVFWELWNLFPNIQSKIESLSENEYQKVINKIQDDIDYLLNNLSSCNQLIINKFQEIPYQRIDFNNNRFSRLINIANNKLESSKNKNLKIIDCSQIHLHSSLSKTIDRRGTYGSKNIFTPTFLRHYAYIVAQNIIKDKGFGKKVLILDCDNTLWKGIIGEDGFNNIDIDINSNYGSIYNDIQWLVKSLLGRGIIICLCSKNNEEDVIKVIDEHKDMVIRKEDIVKIMANWEPKHKNIIEISNSLNLALDSFVFIDDSDFEINLVKKELPEVTSLLVPKKLSDYPFFLINVMNSFFDGKVTEEDSNRTKMYQAEESRKKAYASSSSIDDYLRSLKMKMYFYENPAEQIERIVQMTQKTNQFNLATIRMSLNEVDAQISSKDFIVYSFSLEDIYGDSGITGVCFVNVSGKIAIIQNFLLSCRVLGRSAENVFLDEVLKSLFKKNINEIRAAYKMSKKNIQVKEFYENNGFQVESEYDSNKEYKLLRQDYKSCMIDFIQIQK